MESLQPKKTLPPTIPTSLKDGKKKPTVVNLNVGKTKPPFVGTISSKQSLVDKKSSGKVVSTTDNVKKLKKVESNSSNIEQNPPVLPSSPFSSVEKSIDIPANTAPPFNKAVLKADNIRKRKDKIENERTLRSSHVSKKSSKSVGFGTLLLSLISATSSVVLAIFLYLEMAPYF